MSLTRWGAGFVASLKPTKSLVHSPAIAACKMRYAPLGAPCMTCLSMKSTSRCVRPCSALLSLPLLLANHNHCACGATVCAVQSSPVSNNIYYNYGVNFLMKNGDREKEKGLKVEPCVGSPEPDIGVTSNHETLGPYQVTTCSINSTQALPPNATTSRPTPYLSRALALWSWMRCKTSTTRRPLTLNARQAVAPRQQLRRQEGAALVWWVTLLTPTSPSSAPQRCMQAWWTMLLAGASQCSCIATGAQGLPGTMRARTGASKPTRATASHQRRHQTGGFGPFGCSPIPSPTSR